MGHANSSHRARFVPVRFSACSASSAELTSSTTLRLRGDRLLSAPQPVGTLPHVPREDSAR